MIPLLALMLLQAASSAINPAEENTKAEIDYCSRQDNQPFRFCLTDRKYERAERELKSLLLKVHRAVVSQRKVIAEFTKQVGGVTLEGDPAAAFESSQKLWEKSSAADCLVVGLSSATGNAGTEGVTAESECEADRMFERIEFLKRTYDFED